MRKESIGSGIFTRSIVMAAPREAMVTPCSRDEECLWSDVHRRAALREIEEQFHLRLTEEEVFRAATLFFSLLSGHSVIDKSAVIQRMRGELVIARGE